MLRHFTVQCASCPGKDDSLGVADCNGKRDDLLILGDVIKFWFNFSVEYVWCSVQLGPKLNL